jgi:hypothetical protein
MRRVDEAGYILPAALAALLAMSVVAAALVAASLNELRRVAAAEQAAADDAALEAAITLATAELLEEPRRRRLAFTSGAEQVSVAGRLIDIRVAWESDKLDLNAAGLEAIDAGLRDAGLSDADRLAIRRSAEARRARGEPARLVDDVLVGEEAGACARRVLTVFGGRSDWTAGGDGETIAIGQPAPGARIAITAELWDDASERGREVVVLVTGDPSAPVRVMDARSTRGEGKEACDGS